VPCHGKQDENKEFEQAEAETMPYALPFTFLAPREQTWNHLLPAVGPQEGWCQERYQRELVQADRVFTGISNTVFASSTGSFAASTLQFPGERRTVVGCSKPLLGATSGGVKLLPGGN